MMIAAARPYLRRFGEPKTFADLGRHHRLSLGYLGAVDGWPLPSRVRALLDFLALRGGVQ
ncbi:type 2 periplasmic-binding domain-containing protein [Novosphingobium terrae]|uniref:hypothetical protein n=1 Tax=Novosphingobium terrae TaxID=2726189 RepID=UPI00198093AD